MTDSPVPNRDELPLPDYDHLPIGSLEGRVRSLDADALQTLLNYEQARGNRLPVVQLLEHRLEAVRGGAELSGGSPLAETPEVQQTSRSGSEASPQTEGPPVNPPSHGNPTNPAQPRR